MYVYMCTVEAHTKELVFVRALKLQFHLLSPLNKNSKEAKMVNDSYRMAFMLLSLKLEE